MLVCICLFGYWQSVTSFRHYQDLIPNGQNVPHSCIENFLWHGIGHQSFKGGGPLNRFGVDFIKLKKVFDNHFGKSSLVEERRFLFKGKKTIAKGFQHSKLNIIFFLMKLIFQQNKGFLPFFKFSRDRVWKKLCPIDSDGDGMTNGQELGDPECKWTRNQIPERTVKITNPGNKIH
ncbi:hypothetical protein KUTeg_021959 [Tegillarca granosa]|uniref:Temptin Cys/Cys disulfide domain-containing protein n=1 Tax=Tegillarca granosa TaxID=220873 RepID=A0ABQ9E5P2_TEGGR|nr:hypothetical protein KUTeg_021959 [Tegillarca granosa]